MSVTIKIGNKTFTKNRIIYISPNGNDSNNGLTEDTPVLTLSKALSLCSADYAIKFMSGDHVFTNSNITFSTSGLLLYSDPTNTTITFNNTSTVHYGIQTTLTSSVNPAYLINLNILFNNSRSREIVNDNFIELANTKIYNCLIVGKFTGPNGSYGSYDIHWLRYGSGIYNSIIYVNYPSSRGSTDNSINVSNSILSNLTLKKEGDYNLGISGSNNITSYTPTSTTIDGIIAELKAQCTDSTGIYIGDYQEWEKLVKHYIYFNKSTNKYEGLLSLNTIYSTTDLNDIVKSDNRFDLYKLNTYFDKLPDNFKSLMYNKLIKG